MKRIKLLLLVAVLFCVCDVNAQVVNIRLDSNSLANLPGSVYLDSSYTLSITIYNDSATTFSGIINIAGLVNGDTVLGDTAIGSVFYYPTAYTVESIPGGQHMNSELIIKVQNPPFIIGTSGVVIWPRSWVHSNPVVNISDTISKTVNVLYPVGIDKIAEKNLKVYMNGQQLVIQDDGNYLLKSVRLYDVSGKLLNEQQISTTGILNMNQYDGGVYLAEINFADNTRMVFKVFNPQ